MTTEQLISNAMALPLEERVTLAQALWESIDAGLPYADENGVIAEAVRRDDELSSGKVRGRTHEEVMRLRDVRWNATNLPSGCRG